VVTPPPHNASVRPPGTGDQIRVPSGVERAGDLVRARRNACSEPDASGHDVLGSRQVLALRWQANVPRQGLIAGSAADREYPLPVVASALIRRAMTGARRNLSR
jgi:hypothetical protein